MRLRSIALSLFASTTTFSTAYAQPRLIEINRDWTWVQYSDGQMVGYATLPLLLAVGFVVATVAFLYDCTTSSSSSSDSKDSDSDSNAVERYEQEAARLRALKRQTDAQTELTASLIDKARIDAEFGEIKQITDHDRKVRGFKRNA